MFPPSAILIPGIAPLTYTEFFSGVLIPFVAILLIQADMDSIFQEAHDAWLASGTWGLVNCPDVYESTGMAVKHEVGDNGLILQSTNTPPPSWSIT